MRLTSSLLGALMVCCLDILSSGQASAQAVQTYRSVGLRTSDLRDSATVYAKQVSEKLVEYALRSAVIEAVPRTASERPVAEGLLRLLGQATDPAKQALSAVSDPELFFRRYTILTAFDASMKTQSARDSQGNDVSLNTLAPTRTEVVLSATPVLHKIPDVDFVMGATVTRGEGSTIGSFELSTNLLGATAGAAFEAIGSEPLKEYFLDNITAGTAFPTGGEARLSATLGIGLGTLRVGKVGIWPALNIEQADSSDVRVPRGIVAANPNESNWSSPLISIAIAPWDLETIRNRLNHNKLAPVFTIGLRLPYYYPNDPFSALAALFSSKRSDYQKAGKVRVQFGVFFPLMRVKKLDS